MSNQLALYDPLFYAQEGLIALRKALGMAGRVYRGYDKAPQQKGSTIMVNVPGTFSATDVNTSTGGTTQDVAANQTSIVLNKWKEVKFGLTDKELTFTTDVIIQDHIMPAAYAIADQIDRDLNTLVTDIPYIYGIAGTNSTASVADILAVRKILFDNRVPLNDGMLHWELDSQTEADLLGLQAFSQFQGAGQAGADLQMSGSLGRKYQFEFFANQNTPTVAGGGDADVAGVASAATKGALTMNVTSVGTTAVIKKGDCFTIAGHSHQYVVTADLTASGGTLTGLAFTSSDSTTAATPGAAGGLEVATTGSEVVTFLTAAAPASKVNSLAFHRNAFCLAMAPLSDMGNQLGARIESITDPVTGLSIRARVFYMPDNSTVKVALDCLYGMKTLDGSRAVRGRRV
jgi:hypothetical protein